MIVFGLLSSMSGILNFLTLRLGFHASATLSRSGWFIEPPAPDSPSCFVLRASRPFYQSQPRPRSAAVIGRHRRHHDHPALQPAGRPLGLTAVPARIFAAPAGLPAFYVIANEGPNIASH